MTQREAFARGLRALGWELVRVGKYHTYSKPGEVNNYYLGSAGACRYGPTVTGSHPINNLARDRLSRAGVPREGGA